ncbi:hypothetical protein ES705_39726 [subsurface metagenome]
MVYNTRSEGLQKGEPSRYIYQLRYSSNYKINHINYAYRIDPFPIKRIVAGKLPETYQELNKYRQHSGTSFLSPSALNTYLNCRLRFYFKYVEGMQEPVDVEEEIESNVFGSILHKSMDILYSDFSEKNMNREDLIRIKKDTNLINTAIDSAFATVFFGKSEMKKEEIRGRNMIVKRVIEKYLSGILDYDIRSAPFHIHSLEKRYEYVLNDITIGGYIDRLDEKEGSVRVIDYKTGKANSVFKNIDDLFECNPGKRNNSVFQTFLYSWLLHKKGDYSIIQPSLYFVRDIYNEKFDHRIFQSVNRNRKPVNDFKEFSEEFEKRLTILVNDLFDSSVPFTQTEDTSYCMNCPYNKICMKNT